MKKIALIGLILSFCSSAIAGDVLIKNVPDGAEDRVKEYALVAIERFVKSRDYKVADEVKAKFEGDIDTIYVANGKEKKYDKPKPVEEEIEDIK